MTDVSNVSAIDSGDITKIGIGVIIALVVLGFLLSLVITAIVGRVIILVVVVVLGIFVWQQRSSVEDKVNDLKHQNVQSCNFDKTFFGIHISAPASVVRQCEAQLKK